MCFNYEGIDFKWVRGTRKRQAALCCIIDVGQTSGIQFNEARDRTEELSLKFLSCLSWELRTGIAATRPGGGGWKQERGGVTRINWKTAPISYISCMPRCTIRDFPTRLPMVSDQYQAHALSLFREAEAASSLRYKFLCRWKILEICQRRKDKSRGQTQTIKWIDDTIEANRWILKHEHFDVAWINSNSIGDYLCKEHRHVIAHVMADHDCGPYSPESLSRLYAANNVMERLVQIFMNEDLGLQFDRESGSNYLILAKKRGKAVPVFIPYETYKSSPALFTPIRT